MSSSRSAVHHDNGVAIVGMSCRFPGARNVDAFWHNILNKVDAVSDPPPEAWDSDVYYDPAFIDKDKVYCRRGGYLGPLVTFDPLAHGIPPVSVGGEPDQWLALQLAFEAFADANCLELPEAVRHRTSIILGKGTYLNGGNAIAVERGLVVGQTLEIIRGLMPELSNEQIELLREEMKRALPPIGPETVPGLVSNIIVGRIANRLDLMGPAYTVDAACASSLVAIQHGIRTLRSGDADLVLAGGSQVWIPIPTLNLFCQLGALSRDQRIRPFDANADGTLLGEGIAMVVLKRLADAERDGDRIYAVIRGTGVASDGRGQSVMAPRIDGEELALRRAYEDAGVSPATVELIEAHGTATPVGDVVEVQALTRVFGKRDGFLPRCALGTVKSMISHTIPAAGTAGIIKTALALHHQVLPPTINCDHPNPKLELESTPFYINTATRPWIHGGSEPRRAGVNAFGFGGINAHVVLEEYIQPEVVREPQRISITSSGHATAWESEVFILEAAAPADLLRQARRLRSSLDSLAAGPGQDDTSDPPFSLADLAYTLAGELGRQSNPLRLAIVADTFQDLSAKLGKAIGRLEDPGCTKIKDVRGIYYAVDPIARETPESGKIAFLFPGEGSQYPNMLADLCLHFPEVRAWFDQGDRIFRDHPRGYLTSDYVYPRPAFSDDERQRDERRLMDMDLAVESVLTANQAVLTLMRGLDLRPDVCLGHSTGEYSALFASGVLGLETETDVGAFTRELNLLYVDAAAESRVPRAMMLAIAADREQVAAIARQAGGDVYLAMDNCPHQAVLVGQIADVERARDIAQSLGLIYEQLTFDRAYHTPLFAEYADQLRSAFARTPIQTAQLPVFSCTTGQPYPDDPEAVRDLMVEHWASPVKFQTTIERLYDDGVRIFVEVGARGNLTAFVEDILRGRPMAAIPANVQRRSGITQLNHLVAMLAVQGVDLSWDFLWRRRHVRQVAWHEGFEQGQRAATNDILLSTSWPMLRLSDDTYHRVRSLSGPVEASGVQPPAGQPSVRELPASHVAPAEPTVPTDFAYSAYSSEEADPSHIPPMIPTPSVVPERYTGEHISALDGPDEAVEAGSAIEDYFETMEHFLEIQREVMGGYLSTDDSHAIGWHPTAAASGSPLAVAVAQTGPGERYPLLGEVVYESPGETLVTRRIFDPHEDRYLLDHTLGRSISSVDPGLRALALMPLTMSLEIVAEAAACLVPEWVVVGFRAVNAHRWIAWEDEPRTLEISARLVAADERQAQVQVALSDLGAIGTQPLGEAPPVLEAIVLLSDAYPMAPAASLVGPIDGAHPSRWRPEQLYSEVMFHGRSWQGVTNINQTSEGGCSATLHTLPIDGFLAGCPEPYFEIDPVTLDAAGQVIGFWTAEHLTTGRVVFPYRVEAVDFFGPPLSPGWELSCRAEIQLMGKTQLRSNIELTDDHGQPLIWLTGWEDKRFELPAQFEPLLLDTAAGTMSSGWPELNALLDGESAVECRRCSAELSSDREFWKRVWALRVLSRAERERFRGLRLPERRQLEWLAARTAAKEALVRLLQARHGLYLRPADVEIDEGEHGRPLAGGAWLDWIDTQPLVSLSHSDGEGAALVALIEPDSRLGFRLGIDIERLRERPAGAGMMEAGFSEMERRLLAALPEVRTQRAEWELRCWCAKEAAAKATGLGLIDGPGSIELVSFDMGRNDLRLRSSEELQRRFPELAAVSIQARTGRAGDLVFAIAQCR